MSINPKTAEAFKPSNKQCMLNSSKVRTSINLPFIIGYTSDEDSNSSSLDSEQSLDFINSKFDALTDIILNESEMPQEQSTSDPSKHRSSPLNAPKLSYMTENILRYTQISLFSLE